MKINRMWAMFDRDHVMVGWTAKPTHHEVIDIIEENYNIKWRHLYKQYGYRIEKIVALRADDFEAEIKAAREEVLELAKQTYDEFPYQRKHPGNLNFLEYLAWSYQEQFHEQPEVKP